MTETTIYIADDDKGVRKILKDIICQHQLGVIVGMTDNGKTAVEEIRLFKPDVVLVDLLMPQIDGIGVVDALRKSRCPSSFIMISQVDSQEMIASAYQHGIEFFISKPVNVVEVIAVVRNVVEKNRLERMFCSLESVLQHVRHDQTASPLTVASPPDLRNEVHKILATLGILGEAGCQDLIEMVLLMMKSKTSRQKISTFYKLSDAYQMLHELYLSQYGQTINPGAIEQRVRRAVKSALNNLANMGIENYYDDQFVRYSSVLFEFGEVRREMDHVKEKSAYGGKTNVKKFVEGLQILLSEYEQE